MGELDKHEHVSTDVLAEHAITGTSVLGSFLPGFGAISALLNGKYMVAQRKALAEIDERLNQIYNDMGNRLTQDEIEQVTIQTIKAVGQESDIEKLELFKNAYKSFTEDGTLTPVTEFVEALELLQSLSLREFNILMLIQSTPNDPAARSMGALTYTSTNGTHQTLQSRFRLEFGLEREEVRVIMKRLSRTGFYEEAGAKYDIGNLVGFENFLSVLGIAIPKVTDPAGA